MRTNPLKARLKAGKKCLGAWLGTSDPMVAELVGQAGYDFVMIDHEHGPGDFRGALVQLQAIRAALGPEAAPSPMMRVPWNDFVYIKRALDIGLEGVMVPNVETAAEAKEAVAACKYPPQGRRGLAFGVTRGSRYGADAAETFAKANQETFVMIQIETPKAVAAIPEIAKVPGVDMLFLGPNDLTCNAGENPLKPSDAVKKLIAEAEAAILKTGLPMGSVNHSGLTYQQLFEKGYALMLASSDVQMIRGFTAAQVAEHRKANG